MAIQRQERRGTRAENDAATGAAGELLYITDEKKIALHDGVTQGGMVMPNATDVQNNLYNSADASGTDTITMTLANPITAYAEYQSFTFKPAANNTDTVTINIDGVGAKAIEKDDGSGSLTGLEADDLRTGIPSTIIYNGTQFVLQTGGAGEGSWQYAELTLSGDTLTLLSSLPASLKEVEIFLVGVEKNYANMAFGIQLGDSGGFETSGYTGGFFGEGVDLLERTDSFVFAGGGTSGFATNTPMDMFMSLKKLRASDDLWVANYISDQLGGGGHGASGNGSKELSGELTQIRLASFSSNGAFVGDAYMRYR